MYVILIDSPGLLRTAQLVAQCHFIDKEALGGCTEAKLGLKSSIMFGTNEESWWPAQAEPGVNNSEVRLSVFLTAFL
ncbi:hypothetical protein I79_011381 [Cricetulus griseus]|uniref:Uncharacterized protein n=1 Tax=Cricetulus griseus TaxID=10029 RepID=G3HKZ8_CRIGR|nr:hypothetical protein I79_011381 [Cricetulus griseus]